MVEKMCYFLAWFLLCCTTLSPAAVFCKHHENPANNLLNVINKNRTAQGLKQLHDSPGLGCMALQYVEFCKANCTTNNTVQCKVREDDFTEVFAPNCGVELPTFGTISGQILGCQSKHVEASAAFSHVLFKDKQTLSLVKNKSYSEVGVGYVGNRKGPFFWGVLFSNDPVNMTFVLDDHGEGIKQRTGCFSGSSFPCNGASQKSVVLNNIFPLALVYIYVIHTPYFDSFPVI